MLSTLLAKVPFRTFYNSLSVESHPLVAPRDSELAATAIAIIVTTPSIITGVRRVAIAAGT